MNKGWIYSNIFNNNFATNFSVSQSGTVLFRYVLGTCQGEITDSNAAVFGWSSVTALDSIFTMASRHGKLPARDSFIEIDNDNVVLLTCKKAEDGQGYILRLWNMADEKVFTDISFNYMRINSVYRLNLVEQEQKDEIECHHKGFALTLARKSINTFRVVPDQKHNDDP